MIQKQFAERVKAVVQNDSTVLGLAVAGSWLSNEIDEFSDLDLILVTKENISSDKSLMLHYAKQFGKLLNAFTGEHVGESRLLICLYDDPLLHVDIKFVTLEEFQYRIENPVILADKDGVLENTLKSSEAKFPYPDYQWIEDRFWVWIHYGLLKIGRGEYLEALDFLSSVRMIVLGPQLHIKNGNLPRGVRKAEMQLREKDLQYLVSTVATHNKTSLLKAIENCIALYRNLRSQLYHEDVLLQSKTEEKVIEYFEEMKNKSGT